MFLDQITHRTQGRSCLKRAAFAGLSALFALAALLCCSRGKVAPPPKKASLTRITIAGSSAMLPLVTEAANRYMRQHPDVAIDVSAGGSSRGIEGLLRHEIDVGTSDVTADGEAGAKLEDHRVAVSAFAAMANRGAFNEKIESLTLDQLRGIFSGSIKNWSVLGGGDQAIVVINRRKGSGTRVTFGSIVLGGDHFVQGLEEESSALVRTMIEQTKGAISYLALSYRRDGLMCFGVAGVAATNDNVAVGKYPIWSFEHMYTMGPAAGRIKDFLDFALSAEIQSTVVPTSGFLPIAKMRVAANAER